MNELDFDFIQDALNAYWHTALMNLAKSELGDVERKQFEIMRNKAWQQMDIIEKLALINRSHPDERENS
jgi:hypothetical protein